MRLTLEGGQTSLEAVRWMLNHFQDVEELSTRLVHGAFLHQLFFEGDLSRAELIAALPGLISDLGKRNLTKLIDAGLIVRIGHGRGQRLVLSPQLQREMGRLEAFVHQTGMMDEHRRALILSFLDAHGKITRAQAAKLLNVPADVSLLRLLGSLVERGDLTSHGNRRGSYYERC